MNLASKLVQEIDAIPEVFKEFSKQYLKIDLKAQFFNKKLKFENIYQAYEKQWAHQVEEKLANIFLS